jgi:hypothetical protein
VLLGIQGKIPDCLSALRTARQEWEQLVAASPDDISYRSHLALCLNNLANGLRAPGADNPAAAREA